MIVDAELRLELAEAQEGYERIKAAENRRQQKRRKHPGKEFSDAGMFTLIP